MHRLPALLLILTLLGACSDGRPTYPVRQLPAGLSTDPAARAAGKAEFLQRCATCHGHIAEGRMRRANAFDPPAPDFSESAYRNIDPAYLFWRIAEGKTVEPFRSRGSAMPAWRAHYSDVQIWQLVVYLQSRARL